MYSTSDFRNGLKILVDDIPYEIVYFQHVKPGKGGAFVRTKIRNLKNEAVIEKTFRAGEKVGQPDIEEMEMQFLYADSAFHFMNTSTYEQIAVDSGLIGDCKLFLKENTLVRILLFNGEVLKIELPQFVVLTISDCDPGLKGDTVSGATKQATLETGATIQVPLFINKGEQIRVDTRSGEYIERI
jgi:elongation factor P